MTMTTAKPIISFCRSPVVPPEISDHIISLCSDKTSLLQCGLVCRSWVPASRECLFRIFPVSFRSHEDTIAFSQLLNQQNWTIATHLYTLVILLARSQGWTEPFLGHLIAKSFRPRDVKLILSLGERDRSLIESSEAAGGGGEEVCKIFKAIPRLASRLHTLTLFLVGFVKKPDMLLELFEVLLGAISACPMLEVLHLVVLVRIPETSGVPAGTSAPRYHTVTRSSPPPRALKKLDLRLPGFIACDVMAWLGYADQRSELPYLERLSLSMNSAETARELECYLGSSEPLIDLTIQFGGLFPVSLKETRLQHLKLEDVPATQEGLDFVYSTLNSLFIHPSSISSLLTLHISFTYTPISSDPLPTEATFESLDALLSEHLQPASDVVVRLHLRVRSNMEEEISSLQLEGVLEYWFPSSRQAFGDRWVPSASVTRDSHSQPV